MKSFEVIQFMTRITKANIVFWISSIPMVNISPMHVLGSGSFNITCCAFDRNSFYFIKPIVQSSIADFLSFPINMFRSVRHTLWMQFRKRYISFFITCFFPILNKIFISNRRITDSRAEFFSMPRFTKNFTWVSIKNLFTIFTSPFKHRYYYKKLFGESQEKK